METDKKKTNKKSVKIKKRRERIRPWNHKELINELKYLGKILESRREQHASIIIKTS